MGAYTPEEALAKKQVAEVGRHNVVGEGLEGTRTANDTARTNAAIEDMRKSFGLKEKVDLGNLSLGGRHAVVSERGASTAEAAQAAGARHDVATEEQAKAALAQQAPLVGAETRHLNAQAAGSEVGTGIAMKQQADMALQQMLQGEKPDSQKSKLLRSAASKVPMAGYKDMQQWTQAVQKQAQQDAQAAMAGGSAPAPTAASPQPNVADRGGLMNVLFGQPEPGGQVGSTPMEQAVMQDAIKRFLLGGSSRFDEQPPVIQVPGEVPTIQIPQ